MTPTTMSLLAAAALSIVTIVAEVIKSTKEKKEEESRRIHDMFAEEETYEGNDDELEVIDDEILIDDNGRVFKPVRKRANLRRDLARRDYSRMYPTYRNSHGASRATRYDVPVRHDYDYAPYNYEYNTRNYARDKYDIEPYDEYLRRQRNSRNYNDAYDFGSIGYNGDYNYDFSHDNNRNYGYRGYKDYYEDDYGCSNNNNKRIWEDVNRKYGMSRYAYGDTCYA